ncbi:MAG: hypothetical protein L0221_12725, partial [Chloroflexi bacterium]|nr:hypothetical protein [Chloroflexota bacterium]
SERPEPLPGARVAPPMVDRTARALALLALAGLLVAEVGQWPPAVAADGGYPAAEATARRIIETADGAPLALTSLPVFKTAEGVEFPLRVMGAHPVPAAEAGALVVVCDRLFESVLLEDCGGPAEDRLIGASERLHELVERFPLSDRTEISIYIPRLTFGRGGQGAPAD